MSVMVVEEGKFGQRSRMHFYSSCSRAHIRLERRDEFIFEAPGGSGVQLTGKENIQALRALGFSPYMAFRVFQAMTRMKEG